jgi:hypothetical protein
VLPADLAYNVTASDRVAPWQYFAAVATVAETDRGDHTEVTVRATAPVTANVEGYLQLTVTKK